MKKRLKQSVAEYRLRELWQKFGNALCISARDKREEQPVAASEEVPRRAAPRSASYRKRVGRGGTQGGGYSSRAAWGTLRKGYSGARGGQGAGGRGGGGGVPCRGGGGSPAAC
ncbi:probable H/ACA ribonucleoprotein complex subunit 1 [Schistocerca cancellata]|uniref:probable H/ACA ribonucleoprotein complex subunit 1 n=1 Tax=Schistocerca cancellata TaxID=274614 RepID=UPI002117FECF|nr:probable H/ACA ribonucleoprotein complex subunit 1 [Schistocerca cancellata]